MYWFLFICYVLTMYLYFPVLYAWSKFQTTDIVEQ